MRRLQENVAGSPCSTLGIAIGPPGTAPRGREPVHGRLRGPGPRVHLLRRGRRGHGQARRAAPDRPGDDRLDHLAGGRSPRGPAASAGRARQSGGCSCTRSARPHSARSWRSSRTRACWPPRSARRCSAAAWPGEFWFLRVRGVSARLWLRARRPGHTLGLALCAATGLPLIVAIVGIGSADDSISRSVSASLIGAGVLSVLL